MNGPDSDQTQFLQTGKAFTMRLTVTPDMTARFFDCEIHPLYATFAIVEHAEYASRCAIRSGIGPDHDAVGSAVEIEHRGGAHPGTVVTIVAEVTEVNGPEVICRVTVTDGEREIARCRTTQRVVTKDRLGRLLGGTREH